MGDLGFHDPSLPALLNANSAAFNPSQWARNNNIQKPTMAPKKGGMGTMLLQSSAADKTFTKNAAPKEWQELIGLFQSGALQGISGPSEFYQSQFCEPKWLRFKKNSFSNGWTNCKKEAAANTNGPAGKVTPPNAPAPEEYEEEEEETRPAKAARMSDYTSGLMQLGLVPLVSGVNLGVNEHEVKPFTIVSINDTHDRRKCLMVTITLASGVVNTNLSGVDYRVMDYGLTNSIFQLKQTMRRSSFDPATIKASYKQEEQQQENFHRSHNAYSDAIKQHEDSSGQQQVGVTQWVIPFKVNKYIGKEDAKVWTDVHGTKVLRVHLYSLEQSSHCSEKPSEIVVLGAGGEENG